MQQAEGRRPVLPLLPLQHPMYLPAALATPVQAMQVRGEELLLAPGAPAAGPSPSQPSAPGLPAFVELPETGKGNRQYM